ncbi:hypothetical protein V494_02060 [Pseudogymnoascus sp. VKM F-4513 (FW-928)]|nr:hypothetical protein V494_02060 [Pseudogymnoascus sp. VKM F-4513 (FW-928)]
MIAYTNAKLLCRLQEAVIDTFGMSGLLCMIRGVNYVVYSILTCTVLHLVALTSPDPDLNKDAREYFTRHMQLLERCTNACPMPDMQQQIDALREAFSADTSKPFDLKPSFPYGSPTSSNQSSPPTLQYQQSTISPTSSVDHLPHQSLNQHAAAAHHVGFTSAPEQSPVSAVGVGMGGKVEGNAQAVQGMVMMAGSGMAEPQGIQGGMTMADPSAWNPAKIFHQWNTTFESPNPANFSAPPPQQSIRHMSNAGADISALPDMMGASMLPLPPMGSSAAPQQIMSQPQFAPVQPAAAFVSPSMWQESVASVYEGGLKRGWGYDPEMDGGKRR